MRIITSYAALCLIFKVTTTSRLMRERMTGSIQLFIFPPSIPIADRIRMLDFGTAPRIYTSWLH
jgi:hypothetical protein